MLKKLKKDRRGKIAKFEILILIIGIIAFAYSVGQSFGGVGAIGDGSECLNAGGTCEIYCISQEENLGHKDCTNDPDSNTPRTCCKDIIEEETEETTYSNSGGGFCSEGQWYNPADYNCLGTKKTDPITQTSCCEGEIQKNPLVDNIETEETNEIQTTSSDLNVGGGEETGGVGEVLKKTKSGLGKAMKGIKYWEKAMELFGKSVPEATSKLNSGLNSQSFTDPLLKQKVDKVLNAKLDVPSDIHKSYLKSKGYKAPKTGSYSEYVAKKASKEVASQTLGQVIGTVSSAIGSSLLGRTIFMKGIEILGASGRNIQAASEGGYVIAGAVTTAALVGTYGASLGIFAASGVTVGAAGGGTALGGGLAVLAGGSVAGGSVAGGGLAVFLAGLSATGVGAIIAAAVVVLMGIFYAVIAQNYAQEKFTYKVFVWQPPVGGENCDECNDLRYGCNEYQCRSYGQACVLLNPDSENPLCVNNNSDDESPPTISSLKGSLPEGFTYSPIDVGLDDSGVKIIGDQKNDCIPPFTALTFGVQTSEPAKCKISVNRTGNYSSMPKSFMSGEGMNIINHTLYVPSSVTASEKYLEDIGINSRLPKIKKGDEYNYYVRCQDANGNENPRAFVVNFCVADKDLSPPRVLGTGIGNKSFVSYNQTSLTTFVSTNEPAICRWDRKDISFKEMSHQMANCATNPAQAIGDNYRCYAKFTGINERFENRYYIRCKDNPLADEKDRNVMQSSEVIKLQGSKLLGISSVSVNDGGNNSKIISSDETVPIELKVETYGGAENGKSLCQYQYEGSYNFNNKGANDFVYINTQKLSLSEGNYEIPIICADAARNIARTSVSFEIEKDDMFPQVTRTYKRGNSLIVMTNEKAECVYTTETCDYKFENGTQMTPSMDGKEHSMNWDSEKTLYIKCKDKFENKPFPRRCSGIISPFEE